MATNDQHFAPLCPYRQVIDPIVELNSADEEVTLSWRCCEATATVGSHGYKRYEDDDVEAVHDSARRRLDVH